MPSPTTDQWLDEAESALGRRLPATLRAVLSSRNGGEIYAIGDVWQLHPVWDKRDRRHLSRTANHLVAETTSLRELDWFPSEAVAIATCNVDRLLLLPADGESYCSTVHLWRFHGDGGVEPVAQSVLELLTDHAEVP